MPLHAGSSKKVISGNIREMMNAGYPKKQAVAASLSNARRHHKADGGPVMPSMPTMPTPEPFVRGGFIKSDVPGRTDTLPMRVLPGSHIIPADVIGGLGQGNSNAGAKLFGQFLAHFGHKEGQPSGGSDEGEGRSIIAAGGEFVVPPEVVVAIGQGNVKKGHDALDKLILEARRHTAARLRQLPGPKK